MSQGYAWEKLYNAVLGMAASPASLQQRIAAAYSGSLMRITAYDDLPADLESLFGDIMKALSTTEPKGDEGSIMASALALTDREAEDIARKIVGLYDQVSARHRAKEDGSGIVF
jgi:hypothetical protein